MSQQRPLVFVSYARRNFGEAQEAVRHLEALGFDVWWDRSLSAAQEWDREIQHQLRQADHVVAIVTEEYLNSSISRYELMAGFERKNLIPIVFGRPRLPPPLSSVHYIDGNDRDWPQHLTRTLRLPYPDSPTAAPTPQSQRRSSRPAIGTLALQELRVQSFYWLGVGGAVITLAGNLDAFLVFANWIEWINVHWAVAITWFWNFIVPFDFHIYSEDAVVLTLLAVLFFNLLLTSSDAQRNVTPTLATIGVLLLAIMTTAYIGFVGFVHELDTANHGVTDQIMQPVLSALRTILPDTALDAVIIFIGMTLAGSALLLILYVPIALIFSIRPNVGAFGARLWRILLGVAIVAVLNQISLSIEAQEWTALLKTAPPPN